MARKGKKKNHKQPALSESTKEESPNIEINHSDSKFKSKARDACKIKMLRAWQQKYGKDILGKDKQKES